MLPEGDRSRPAGNGTASNDIDHDDYSIVTAHAESCCRCTRCRRPLTADLSVRLGIGPRCRGLVVDSGSAS
ncbi:DUF6011 domain-containing protein [Nocardioides sp. Iso805N]|uniref:DUF6011 domain-containing protein n=1 Tax=Nocardioides sp. Iso805N TaxID=1283287 RepID=UPI003FA4B078